MNPPVDAPASRTNAVHVDAELGSERELLATAPHEPRWGPGDVTAASGATRRAALSATDPLTRTVATLDGLASLIEIRNQA